MPCSIGENEKYSIAADGQFAVSIKDVLFKNKIKLKDFQQIKTKMFDTNLYKLGPD